MRLVLFFALVTSAFATVTICPKEGSIAKGLKYHSDAVCDRESYNLFKSKLGRPITYQNFKATGGVAAVPNQKTVKCPAGGSAVNLVDQHQQETGMDTVFFVENSSSTAIVLSYLDTKTAMEVSAVNSSISPAIADPNAIIQPGSWMAVFAFEGHQFIAREVLKNGVAGNVLLQHRAGLIPVGTYADNIDCPEEDIEPIVDNALSPVFQRTMPPPLRPCNTMDIGFRNVAKCPLHIYYVHGEGESCQESFKFHLGLESVSDDFMWDWKSQTKFEGTFIGHTFHFRLAANPAILVDSVTIQPVVVTDCPVSTATVAVSTKGDAIANNVELLDRVGDNNATFVDLDDLVSNSTGGQRLAGFSHTV